jgi:hypothetical protein
VRARGFAIGLLCAGLASGLSACGGDSDRERGATTPRQERREPAPSVPGGSLEIPQKVPRKGSTEADPRAIEVIRGWTNALRRSDVRPAAGRLEVPSKVQNGTPVLTLDTLADVRLFNDSLSCGSRLVGARGAADGFTVADFRLTNRPGADCGSGTGHRARAAILVRGGRIAEWYRIPDPGAPEPGTPTAPQEPEAPII